MTTHTIDFQDKSGHEQVEYNPDDKENVKQVKKRVQEALKKGMFLFGAKKGDPAFKLLTSADALDDDKLDRFMLSNEKATVAPPPTAG